MHNTEFSSERRAVSTPPGVLDAHAFGTEAYNPAAYGAMTGQSEAPSYARVEPVRRKTLDELNSDAQLELFAPRSKQRRNLLWAGAVILAALVAVVGVSLLSESESALEEPAISVVSEEASERVAPAGVAANSDEVTVEPDVAAEPPVLAQALAHESAAAQPPAVDVLAGSRNSVMPSRSKEYRALRTELQRSLRTIKISAGAAAARSLLQLGEPLDWEAHRWTARALRLNGELRKAADVYASFVEAFPSNRYAKRAALWTKSLRRRVAESDVEASASKPGQEHSALNTTAETSF
ncbi:MAG: hypothetical protein AAF658_03500 [Myxococcota bacterium]